MSAKPNEASDWAAYEPSGKAPWNRQRVVHLHRRAAFAATHDDIERDFSDGPQAAVDRLLSSGRRSPKLAQADFREAGQRSRVSPRLENASLGETGLREFETMAHTIGDAAQASGSVDRLKAWWLYRMLASPDPLTERLTLLWHNHFATSYRKVQDLVLMREQNELLRRHSRGLFGELLAAIVKHPAMLVWLDSDSNRAGHPNENLARELLELFTIGIGNYDETDVREAARALTGWSIGGNKFRFVSQRHDAAEKRFLGRRGVLDGDALLSILLEHPATSRRILWRLSTQLFGEGVVADDALSALADDFRARRLDIAWAVETMLRSNLFFSDLNMRTRVLGPVEFAVGAIHALDLRQPPPSTLLVAEWITRMGQDLFMPPNVGGWPEGRAWLGSRSLVARANFAAAMAVGGLWNSEAPLDLWALLELPPSIDSLGRAVRQVAQLLWGEAPEEAIEFAVMTSRSKPLSAQLPAALVALLSRPEAQLG